MTKRDSYQSYIDRTDRIDCCKMHCFRNNPGSAAFAAFAEAAPDMYFAPGTVEVAVAAT